MDGTFKCCPKGYYQLYNILGKDKNTGLIIPLIFVLMSHKSYDIYYYVFEYIKAFLKKEEVIFDKERTSFMLDFEKSSRKALKNVFQQSNILGFYFHYVKALWSKSQKRGFDKKKYFIRYIYFNICIYDVSIYCSK